MINSFYLFIKLVFLAATMTKIIKEMLPPDVRVARDAQDLLIECCVGKGSNALFCLFLFFILIVDWNSVSFSVFSPFLCSLFNFSFICLFFLSLVFCFCFPLYWMCRCVIISVPLCYNLTNEREGLTRWYRLCCKWCGMES